LLDARSYGFGPFGVNPAFAVGATEVPEQECRSYAVEALYDIAHDESLPASEDENLAARHPELVARLRRITEDRYADVGQGEEFDLELEDERRLRSLGYIE